MSTSYADSAQARLMDERMFGSADGGATDDWFDDDAVEFFAQCTERERKFQAAMRVRIRIAMGQMEAVLAKQGGSV